MSTRVVERVDDWDQEPFSGGYRELQNRADADFSGVFRAGGAELFMTRGTVVGIRRGSIEDFEAASGSVFTAPTDALPLLAIMQDRSEEVRAKYYTEDTGITEVDGTLEDGGFTGYLELSENVLSGDYYLVYHQGHSMSVAYVGNSVRLITGDEAFEQTDGEVGIYEVRPVDIEPIEIPEPVADEPDETTAAGGGAGTGSPAAEESGGADPSQTEASADPAAGGEQAANPAATDESTEAIDDQPPATDGRAGSDGETAGGQSTGTATGAGVGGAAGTEEATTTAEDPPETSTTASERTDAAAPAETGRETAQQSSTDGAASAEQSPAERETTTEVSREGGEHTQAGETTAEERRRASESLTERGETETDDEAVRGDPLGQTPAESDTTDDHTATERAAETGATPATETEASTGEAQPPGPAADDRPPQRGTGSADTTGTTGQATGAREGKRAATDDPGQLETRSIPSLDPELSVSPNQSTEQSRRDTPGRADSKATPDTERQTTEQQSQQPAATDTAETETASTDSQSGAPESDTQTSESGTTTADPQSRSGSEQAGSEVAARIEELEELLEERETELNRLESDLQTTESERDSLRRELDQVRTERDELQTEVEKLEAELRRLEEELGAATDAQQRMTPQEALTGTDLFVRYDSKGDATLAKARDSGLRKQDVAGNLQLEKHTQFEADVAAVGGREYDQFLEDTVAHKFAQWVVYDLLFEIQSTGHTDALADLYTALPKINRIELNGAVNATYVEDGEQVQSTESFDVVFRERMGDPLLVANINESRQGATEGMMEQLITAAERVGQTSDQFAAAFLVTESFFEPEALETVEQVTRGGILSRDKRKSFVNLSRKNGYHLCLVEARNENFHLEVPEL